MRLHAVDWALQQRFLRAHNKEEERGIEGALSSGDLPVMGLHCFTRVENQVCTGGYRVKRHGFNFFSPIFDLTTRRGGIHVRRRNIKVAKGTTLGDNVVPLATLQTTKNILDAVNTAPKNSPGNFSGNLLHQ